MYINNVKTKIHENKLNVSNQISPVFFMFFSLLNMLISFGLILFLELETSLFISSLFYLILFCIEFKYGIKSPLTICIMILFFLLFIALNFGVNFEHKTGVIIYSVLAILVGGLLLLGKPFTLFYSLGQGLLSLHYANSIIWLAAYLISIFTSIYFVPSIEFIIYPFSICLLAGVFTLYINLFWFGTNNSRKKEFQLNEFSFKQINIKNLKEIKAFHEFYIQNLLESENKNIIDANELKDFIEGSEKNTPKYIYIFCAFDQSKNIIGSIRCILKSKEPFPVEKDAGINLRNVTKIGSVMEVGRFSIDADYRDRPELINGLFKCLIEFALDKDIDFIFGLSTYNRINLYLKIGFNLISSGTKKKFKSLSWFGIKVAPVFLNFSSLIINNNEKETKEKFIKMLSLYLTERWFKRTVLRYYIKKKSKRPWEIDANTIRKLVE